MEGKEKTTMKDVIEATSAETNQMVANKFGITREYLFRRLKRELNASDTITLVKKDKEGQDKIEKRKIPMWGTRQKARMDAHKLLSHYPADSHDVNVGGTIPVEVFTGRPPPKEENE